MTRSLVWLFTALALAGCVGSSPPPRAATGIRVPSASEIANADYGLYPSQYDAVVRAWFSAHAPDPRSIQFGKIFPPIREHIIVNRRPFYGYAVCAEVGAKNRAGAYSGLRRHWVFLRDHVVRRVRDPRGDIYIGHPYRCEEAAAENDGG